ncbi:MAG TPA: sialidase family protein [Solirubrobacteraceae bacterium]
MIRRIVVLTAALVALPATALAANTPAITDPYTNADSQHRTAVEPDTFAFGSTLVVASQIGRYFDGGASGIGVATSTNNGVSFTSQALPGLTNNPPVGGGAYDRATDPVVAYDLKHNTWMVSSLLLSEAGGLQGAALVVNRSTDGGFTWGAPVNVALAGASNDYDKNWVACDNHTSSPFYGNCYHTFDDFGDGDRILMSTSHDGGLTWSAPVATAGGVFGLGGQPLVQPDGDVIVPAANAFETAVIAFRSTNGGATWGDEVVISRARVRTPSGPIRSGSLPSAEIDSAGRVYVTWQDCRYRKGCKANDIVMSASDDGVTWAPVSRVPIDPLTSGADHFIPGLGVRTDTTGRLGLTYYFYDDAACGGRKTAPCGMKVGYVQSNNGGANWSAPQTLAGPFPVAWVPDTTQGRMVGDYISTSWIGDRAYGAFAVSNGLAGTTFDQRIYVPSGGVNATSFPSARVKEQAFSDTGAQQANPVSVIRRER